MEERLLIKAVNIDPLSPDYLNEALKEYGETEVTLALLDGLKRDSDFMNKLSGDLERGKAPICMVMARDCRRLGEMKSRLLRLLQEQGVIRYRNRIMNVVYR